MNLHARTRQVHVAAQHPAVGDLSQLHVPSGPIAFETVLQFLIVEGDVRPLRDDWAAILQRTQSPSSLPCVALGRQERNSGPVREQQARGWDDKERGERQPVLSH